MCSMVPCIWTGGVQSITRTFFALASLGLLERSAVVLADQVLWTGASLFLWDVARRANCSTRIVPVNVKDDAIDEDYISVSAFYVGKKRHNRPSSDMADLQSDVVKLPPSQFEQLHTVSELFREKWVDSRASVPERITFARNAQQQMLAELANIGFDASDGILPSAP